MALIIVITPAVQTMAERANRTLVIAQPVASTDHALIGLASIAKENLSVVACGFTLLA